MQAIAEVLTFWFSEVGRQHWFAPTPDFDREVRERFADLAPRAARGELSAWERSPSGCVALCILLDQMPRNMYRGTRRAYAADHLALEVAERAVDHGLDRELPPARRRFLYLPFSHSERLADQLRAVALFEAAGLDEALVYVRGHLRIIRQFGRFPHRNAILGRASTPEELEFLAHHPDDYGQSAKRAAGAAGGTDPDPIEERIAAAGTAARTATGS